MLTETELENLLETVLRDGDPNLPPELPPWRLGKACKTERPGNGGKDDAEHRERIQVDGRAEAGQEG